MHSQTIHKQSLCRNNDTITSCLWTDNTDFLEPWCWDPIHFFNSSRTSHWSMACPLMTLNFKLADQYHLKKWTTQRQNCSFRRKTHFLSAFRTVATSRWCFWNVRALLPYRWNAKLHLHYCCFSCRTPRSLLLHVHCKETYFIRGPLSRTILPRVKMTTHTWKCKYTDDTGLTRR